MEIYNVKNIEIYNVKNMEILEQEIYNDTWEYFPPQISF